MGLKRKLKQWQGADLINQDQAKSILSHERQGIGQKYFRGLVGIALLSIFGGAALIVAANWADISGSLKLLVHFSINAALAYILWQGKESGHFWKREGAVFILAGLNLTLIALIGQVFQLSGDLDSALLLWLIITTPFIFLFGTSRMNAVMWTAGFIITLGLNLYEIIDQLDMPSYKKECLFIFVAASIPGVLLLSGMNAKLRALRPEWQQSYILAGSGLIIATGVLTSLAWYGDASFLDDLKSLYWFPAATAIFWAAIFIVMRSLVQSQTYKALCLMAAVTSLFALIAALPIRPEIDTMATVHFVLFMAVIGYFAIPLGMHGLVTLAVLFITLRLFIFYIELTGPMFAMGFGLIITGILLLVALRFALKIDKKIKAKLFDKEA
tara:strand:+ start:171428 stop:172579 length:1152 start_codon:yes stop_codon:yes gene_type:complete